MIPRDQAPHARDAAGGKAAVPGFGKSFSDVEVAAVSNYVTVGFGAWPSRITPREAAKSRAQP
jgi:hypothetical protein